MIPLISPLVLSILNSKRGIEAEELIDLLDTFLTKLEDPEALPRHVRSVRLLTRKRRGLKEDNRWPYFCSCYILSSLYTLEMLMKRSRKPPDTKLHTEYSFRGTTSFLASYSSSSISYIARKHDTVNP